jgi:uncharacterized protein (UPF0332 family)
MGRMTSAKTTELPKSAGAERAASRRARPPSGEAPKPRRANPAGALWVKAQNAARSASVLLQSGDSEGAANRAYYAVFSAARAALASVRASLAASKGHATIVRRLEKHLVQERGLDNAFGRTFFGNLSHMRWVADYGDAAIDAAAVRAMVGEALRFLVAIEPFVRKAKP